MKTKILALLILISTVPQVSSRVPQEKSSDLSTIEGTLVNLGEQAYAGWKHKTVTPLEGAYDVIIHQWSSDETNVSISFVRYSSDDQARQFIRQFARDMKASDKIQEDSNEAYSLKDRGNSVAIRKKRIVVYIKVNAKDPATEKEMLKQANKLAFKAVKG